MEHWLMDMMEQYGYLGIVFLVALENVFPPIPSEVILTFGGFLTTTSSLTIVGVVLSSTAGSVIGAIILYAIGLQLDVDRVERIVSKWGHILRVTKKDVYRADGWFTKYGAWTVFFCRFVPVVRSLISIPAGMSKMPMGLFLLLTTLGTLIWNTILVFLGASVGESWDVIIHYTDRYQDILEAIIVVLFILWLIKIVKKGRR
ncbi:DedA family protein [Aquibacillus albus]|uniref:Membrane protein DedA with SNARE-associated domain n=1 Tax=Aquibacillus albus TaxID=1168171 RepID=A0ABS2N685_9BACI|nr:DedA family protein [Aquibacillus albus]MBM7573667.1 membrane protein DedA with SNARE-associated domain [Aquibacillus albus]